MKKIVILNASPRKTGLISQMLGIMRDELIARGDEVTFEEVCRLSVRPCIACMKCRTSLECSLPEDDAQRVLRLVQQCDAVIIGSPCYWGNMNGQLKVLLDRWVYGMMGESLSGIPKPLHKGKKAVIVSTCNTIWPWSWMFHQTTGVIRALKEMLFWSGFKVVGNVQKAGTRKKPVLTDSDRRHCIKVLRKI